MNNTAKKPKVTITTDGGCDPNPGVGAWAAILRYGDNVKAISGIDQATTNNRMELTAIVSALELLRPSCCVRLRTDSQYAIWAIAAAKSEKKKAKWQRKGKNIDLVARLWAEVDRHAVTPIWVKGHAGDADNETCDQLCADKIKQSTLSPHA